MQKHLSIIIIAAVFLCLAVNSMAASIPNNPAYETGLQQALDQRTAGGQSSIDVTADMIWDQVDSYWQHTATAMAGTTVLFEIAGYADTNSFGIYDRVNRENTIQLFSGRDGAMDRQTIYFDGMAEGGYLLSAGSDQSVFGAPSFGFYLDVPNENARWYSDTLLNNDAFDHMLAYQGPGDSFSLRNDGYYQAWESSEYILAWEDLAEQSPVQDYSFNDFVVMVNSVIPSPVPEPATMLLFGIGLVGLAGIGIRRRERKA